MYDIYNICDNMYIMFVNNSYFFKLYHIKIHSTGRMLVLAKGQNAFHQQTIDPGDHGQKSGSTPDIFSRL